MAAVTDARWAVTGTATFIHDGLMKEPGDTVTVAAVVPAGYNGTWTVIACYATGCVVLMALDPGPYVSGGTIT